jgi:hypothetical protein
MIRFRIIFFFIILLCKNSLAQQNLVPNCSFEEYLECPTLRGGIDLYVPYWFTPMSLLTLDSVGSCEYYHACGTLPWSVPKNISGYQDARTGAAYSGVMLQYLEYTFDHISGVEYFLDHREYLEVQLTDLLMSGKKYCFEIFYSISERYTDSYIPVSLGVLFSDSVTKRELEMIHYSNISIEYFSPITSLKALQSMTNFTPETDGWFKISGEYVANGGERYITIGSFDPLDTISERLVYVYIDDVSIWLCEEEPDSLPLLLVCYPNPADEEITFSFNQVPENETAIIEIFTRHGEQIGAMKLAAGVEEMKVFTGNLAQGIYLARVIYASGEQASVKFIIRR